MNFFTIYPSTARIPAPVQSLCGRSIESVPQQASAYWNHLAATIGIDQIPDSISPRYIHLSAIPTKSAAAEQNGTQRWTAISSPSFYHCCWVYGRVDTDRSYWYATRPAILLYCRHRAQTLERDWEEVSKAKTLLNSSSSSSPLLNM